ncbi:MAG: SAM-dependent methyltransferase, partial [Patescibacteria group bacterium]
MVKVFEFGPAPLANAFLKRKQLNCAESFYPLNVFFCKYCNLLQLKDIVDPRILFRDYVYVSSTSEVFGEHFKDFSQKSIIRFHLSHKSLVIDIGSNDG